MNQADPTAASDADCVAVERLGLGARLGRMVSARRRVLLSLSVLYGPAMVLTNAVGGILVAVFLVFVMPIPAGVSVSDDVVQGNLVRFAIYLGVSVPIGYGRTVVKYRRVLRWLASDRDPTDEERRMALRLPYFQSAMVIVLWLVALPLFVPPMAAINRELGRQVAVAITIGALGTTAGTFLVSEQFLRGLARQALRGVDTLSPIGPSITQRILVAWVLGTGLPLGAIAGIALSIDDPSQLVGPVLFLAAVGLATGALAIGLALRTVRGPIADIAAAVERIADGDLDVEVDVYDASEIGILQSGLNHMAVGLRERERLSDLFGRHVGTEVARRALDTGTDRTGTDTTAAVVFVDIVGSSRLTTEASPEAVLSTLNRFFDAIVTRVHAHGGWVNKFVGDEAMCVWGAPVPDPDAATNALACARQLHLDLRSAVPDVDHGIGVAWGPVAAGNLGNDDRFEYTVVGDAVVEAARLTERAKTDPARVLAARSCLDRADASEAARWLVGEAVVLRGRTTPTALVRPVVEL